MARLRLLFVGDRNNLQKIYNDCPDSSSESAAEIAFGADWISDYDWIDEDEKKRGWTTDNFTKNSNPTLYQEVIDGLWVYCYDIRNPKVYGSFDCLNCPDFEPYDGTDNKGKDLRNKNRTIEAFKNLPEDTIFHFAESHW